MTDDPKACAEDPELVLPRLLAKAAKRSGDRPFLQEVTGRSATYGELDSAVHRWAAGLRQVGLEPGDRVGSFLPQSIDAHTAWLAAARLGLLHVPINPELVGDLLRHVLDDSGVSVAFCRPHQIDLLRRAGIGEGVRLVAVPASGEPAGGGATVSWWPEIVDRAPPLAVLPQPTPADVAAVIYTSGTTGPAKGVLVTWAQLSNNIGIHPREMLGADQAYYVPWPPFHVMGLSPLPVMAAVRARVVLRERVSVSHFWEEVIRHRCAFATIGPIGRLLLDQPPGTQDEANPLLAVVGLAGPDREEFQRRFDVRGTQVYGSTEVAYPLVNREADVAARSFRGWLRPGYGARIVDEDLRDVPDEVPGELLVAPPVPELLSRGYLGRPDLTQASRIGEWYRTGDLFIRRPDGSYEFVDRSGDSIRRFGENISSGAIETAAMQQPGVLECAAVAAPSAVAGEEVHLAVVASSTGLEPATLVEQLAAVLPAFMVPSVVSLWPALPKTPNGKVQKAAVRKAGVPAGAWCSAQSAVRRAVDSHG